MVVSRAAIGPMMQRLAQLREDVAAVGMPDEGMRGTAADDQKLKASLDRELHVELELALMTGAEGTAGKHESQELVEVASRVIRSISITPSAAERVANAVAGGLVAALRARCGLRWLLAAMIRLAQHVETHPALLHAGALPAVAAAWFPQDHMCTSTGEALPLGGFNSTANRCTPRLDIVGCIFLSFLSESEAAAHAVAMVPTQAIAHLVRALDERLALASVCDNVSSSPT